MTTANQIQQLIVQRLAVAMPTASIKHGWIDTYWQHNEVWPLVTVAPAASDPQYSNGAQSIKDTCNWSIYVLDQVDRTETEISQRLLGYLKTLRQTLIAPPTSDRHNNYGGLLTGQPEERAAARFIQPESGLPFAGLTFILTTTYSETLE